MRLTYYFTMLLNRKKILIVSGCILLVGIVSGLVFWFAVPHYKTYENKEYHMAFEYPSKWTAEQKIALDKDWAIFRDNRGAVVLTMTFPYSPLYDEVHAEGQEMTYKTNDSNTILWTQKLLPTEQEPSEQLFIAWQPGCTTIDWECFNSKEGGGGMIFELGSDAKTQQEVQKGIEHIIESFRMTTGE